MAFWWTGATSALGSVVRNENNKWSRVTGWALFPRVPVHGRQIPAKKKTGRLLLIAYQVQTFLPLRLAKAGDRHQAAIFGFGEPIPSIVALGVANVRHWSIRQLGRRRKSPAHSDQFASVRSVADDWRHLIGKDARLGLKVAGVIRPPADGLRQLADRLFVRGYGIEVTHWSARFEVARPYSSNRSGCNCRHVYLRDGIKAL